MEKNDQNQPNVENSSNVDNNSPTTSNPVVNNNIEVDPVLVNTPIAAPYAPGPIPSAPFAAEPIPTQVAQGPMPAAPSMGPIAPDPLISADPNQPNVLNFTADPKPSAEVVPDESFAHWMLQRVSALLLVFLAPAALWMAYSLKGLPLDTIYHKLGTPKYASVLLPFALTSLYHAKLGMEMIITDYMPESAFGKFVKGLVDLTAFISMIACIAAIAYLMAKELKY